MKEHSTSSKNSKQKKKKKKKKINLTTIKPKATQIQ